MSIRQRIVVVATAGALVVAIAPAVFAGQPQKAPPETGSLTVVTDTTWLVNGGPTTAIEECAHPYWTASIAGASWIWAPFATYDCPSGYPATAPGGDVTFSTTFDVPGTPQSATLQFAVDNTATVYLNGTKVASLLDGTAADFQTGWSGLVTDALVTGTNTIRIVAANAGSTSCAYCNPAGLLAGLTVSYALTSTSECKDGGWQNWDAPAFVNQGDCVSYVVSRGNDPSQEHAYGVSGNQGLTNGNGGTQGPKSGNDPSQGHGNGNGGSKP